MARQRTKTAQKQKPTVVGRTGMYEAVGALVKDQGLRWGQLERAVRATFQAITTALAKGQQVTLPGFGTFYASKRPAATVRLPDGTPKKVPTHRVPRFRPGAVLKRTVARR
jgi:DNA-binding protein HU-beta